MLVNMGEVLKIESIKQPSAPLKIGYIVLDTVQDDGARQKSSEPDTEHAKNVGGREGDHRGAGTDET